MFTLTFIVYILSLLAFCAYFLFSACRYQLHMLQQNTYVNSQYWHWLQGRGWRDCRLWDYLLLVPMGVYLFSNAFFSAVALLFISLLLLLIYGPNRVKAKKPFALTKRMKRLYLTVSVLTLLYVAGFGVLSYALDLVVIYIALLAAAVFAWAFVLLANLLMQPVERRINQGFFRAAQAKLRSVPGLTVVGITGSYGKTSVKMILAALLQEKFATLATPHSYNTPMGVSLTVNNQLRPTTEVFICEMGARHRQDIQEMCDLARPDLAVLTAIGEQHLETFGSQENIIAAKTDILRNLAPGGTAFVNGDNAYILGALPEFHCPIVRYGLDPANDYWADDISFGRQGMSFLLHKGEETFPLTTSLLGRHNVCNIVGCIAVALHMGVDMKHISHALKKLPPVEHRLQLIPAGNYTVIDDAFNSNPAGATAALEVLGAFAGGPKIIITPGMVELGERQYQLNYEFGMQLPQVCDHIILVGPEISRPIREGAEKAGVKEGQLFVAGSLNEARGILQGLLKPGAVVLYENDLPDTYNE